MTCCASCIVQGRWLWPACCSVWPRVPRICMPHTERWVEKVGNCDQGKPIRPGKWHGHAREGLHLRSLEGAIAPNAIIAAPLHLGVVIMVGAVHILEPTRMMLATHLINQGKPLDMRDVGINAPSTWSDNVAVWCLCILMNAGGKAVETKMRWGIAILVVLLICVHT
jgi:hypothetical protein